MGLTVDGETDPPLDSDSPDWAGPPLSLRRGLGGVVEVSVEVGTHE